VSSNLFTFWDIIICACGWFLFGVLAGRQSAIQVLDKLMKERGL